MKYISKAFYEVTLQVNEHTSLVLNENDQETKFEAYGEVYQGIVEINESFMMIRDSEGCSDKVYYQDIEKVTLPTGK